VSDRAGLIARLLARVRAARRYPELARRRELEGTVRIGFMVAPDGHPLGLRVVHSADPVLDEAARDAVERAAPLPLVEGPIEVDLEFQLSAQ
jgi:protein TonB